jgi:tetratricopeptide (TPR) repeat protein
MKKLSLLLILLLFNAISRAIPQQDSLQALFRAAQSDTSKFRLATTLTEVAMPANIPLSLEYAQYAVNIAENLDIDTLRIKAYALAGKACFYAGLIERAVVYFNDCSVLAEKTGDVRRMAIAHMNLGSVYNQLGNFAKSREYTDKGLELMQRQQQGGGARISNVQLMTYHNNMGLLDLKEEKFESSGEHYRKALSLADTSQPTPEMSRTLSGFADLLIKTGKFDSALSILKLQATNDSALGILSGQNIMLLQLGEIAEMKDEISKAFTYFHAARALAISRNDNFVLERVSDLLAGLFRKTGKSDSALHYIDERKRYESYIRKGKGLQAMQQRELERQLTLREQAFRKKWYAERICLGIAVLLSIGAVIFLSVRFRKKSRLRDLDLSLQAEKLKLMNEQLNLKDKQLAAQAIYSLQRNELISDLVTKFQKLETETPEKRRDGIGKVLKDLEQAGKYDPWQEFEQRFQEVHAGFYERLLEKFPDLTPNERRLCAFLRLDMSTKEISNLTGQSIKAITQARFRLRSKLRIENPDISLFEVLLQI